MRHQCHLTDRDHLSHDAYNTETYMKIGPKYKICKRLGAAVFEKCQTQKYALSEGRAAKNKRRRGRQSEYGLQLLEKQKARYTYGITEKQFSSYFKDAMSAKGTKPTDAFYERLESRLDSVVFRLGLAQSRRMSRQLVSHGHIMVNGRKVTIPSYSVQKGDVISVRNKEKGVWTEVDERYKHYTPPTWLVFDEKKLEGKVEGTPIYDPTTELFSLSKVLEFYSR